MRDYELLVILGAVALVCWLLLRALGEVANQIAQLRTELLRYHTRMGEGHLLREIGHATGQAAESLHRIEGRGRDGLS